MCSCYLFHLGKGKGEGQEGNAFGYIHCPTRRHERRHKDTVKGTVGSTQPHLVLVWERFREMAFPLSEQLTPVYLPSPWSKNVNVRIPELKNTICTLACFFPYNIIYFKVSL